MNILREMLAYGFILGSVYFLVGQNFLTRGQTCNPCGLAHFNIEQAVQDSFLVDEGRNLAAKIVQSDSECFAECSLDFRCMSFSVCENLCQLNAGSRYLVKNSLRPRPGCRYYDFYSFEVRLSE